MVYTFNMLRLYHISKWKFIGILGALSVVIIVFFIPFIRSNTIFIETYSNLANILTAGGMDDTTQIGSTVEPQKKDLKILILGDMMFDRTVRSKINRYGFEYVFGPATTTFADYDLVVANLEGPITTYKSKTVLENNKSIAGFQFTFATGTAKALKDAGIDIVSLANNHTDNFGKDGLNQTRKFLDDAGIRYFGSPQNIDQNNSGISTSTCISTEGDTSHTNITELDPETRKNSICIGFVGWHEFGTKNHQKILDEIVRMRPLVDYLVVFPHWGEEYKKKPHVEQIRLARVWSDAGADVIIGAHPHVIQQITRRTTADGRTVPIFYSLGNFIFDQYFSFDTTHGIAVEIEFPLIQKTQKISDSKASTTPALHEIAKYTQYKILPFSSVGTKVSIPSSTSTARIFEDIEKVSGTSTWEWLKK